MTEHPILGCLASLAVVLGVLLVLALGVIELAVFVGTLILWLLS